MMLTITLLDTEFCLQIGHVNRSPNDIIKIVILDNKVIAEATAEPMQSLANALMQTTYADKILEQFNNGDTLWVSVSDHQFHHPRRYHVN